MKAIYHCADALAAAASNRAIPIRAMVGVMARGPINLRTSPIRPENPISTWNNEATMIAPWIYSK